MRTERNRSVDDRAPSGAAVMQPMVTEALARSFFAEWASAGYAGMSLERVARTAGSGKAALYRRWPDKATMAGDLLHRVGLTLTDIDDHGSLEADLMAFLLAVRRVFRHPTIRRVVADIHAELDRNAALARAVRPFQDARRARVSGMIDRGIARGELPPDLDRDLAADFVAAPLYWSMAVIGRRIDQAQLRRLCRSTIAALQASGSASFVVTI